MSRPLDDDLYQDPDLARFYDSANGWGADFDYCMELARDASTVLDLGCGTGELARRSLSPGRQRHHPDRLSGVT